MHFFFFDLLVVVWRSIAYPPSCLDTLSAVPYWFAPCAIDLSRIKSGKKFNTREQWYQDMKQEILSPMDKLADRVSRDSSAPCPDGYKSQLPAGVSLPKKVAILSAGGLAPCLSSAIGGLIERYNELYPTVEIICYIGGYKGVLLGDSVAVTPDVCKFVNS